jgi:hypothetical protein
MRAASRRLSILSTALAALALLGGPTAVGAADSRILSVSLVSGDARIIDVSVTAVSFDAASGTITVTGIVTCMPPFEVLLIEMTAVQHRGAATAISGDTTFAPCGDTFSAVSFSGTSFRPGRVTIDILVIACTFRCGEETVRIEAVLVPDNGSA